MTTATAFGDVTLFHRLPKRHPAPGFEAEGVEAFFYDGPCCGGRATRIFAWYGRPENASPEHPVPGVVLIHGGGFNWAQPDHFRIVYLPRIEVLREAMEKMKDFFSYYRQD